MIHARYVKKIRNTVTHPEVPRIDLQSLSHIARDTHKLRQHEWALLALFLCEHEFHTGSVHAVSKRSDHSKIGDTEEGIEFVLLDGLVTSRGSISMRNSGGERTDDVLMMNWNEIKRTIFAVDMGYDLGDLPLEFWRIRKCRRRDLNENNISNPLRVVLKELLEGSELSEGKVISSDGS